MISCRETYRSLNNGSRSRNEVAELFVGLVFGLLILFATLNGNAVAAEAGKSTADIMRQDIVQFQGPISEKDARNGQVSGNSFQVRLNRHVVVPVGQFPTIYGMSIKGVDPVEQALLQDAQDGRWDNFDLFRASLIAEGIRDPKKIRELEARLDGILKNVNDKLQAAGIAATPEVLTKEVFEALHREILTSTYDIDCTDLVRSLETGHFNCVSATVLFNCVGEKAGLNVCALEMPGHALSRVRFGNESMNLETTCPNWFSLQNEAARKNATLSRTATAASPANGNPGLGDPQTAEATNAMKKLREISPVQLVATIYYNQGVDFLNKKNYPEAIVANLKALQLDPVSETAWGNLLAAINNWSIELVGEQKRYDLAATLLDQGVYLDPNYDKFRENQLHIYYHWIHALSLEGRNADAGKVFEIADQRLPNDPDLRALMQAIGK